jgi:antitoxin (DNA-binding transcriptional repressor) of toxin-antitoxin stability system
MYNMKRYTAAQARQRLAAVLDEAERGEAVIIERRGIRFRLQAERRSKKAPAGPVYFDTIDPVIESGNWTWVQGPGGLIFKPKPDPRRRKK